MTTRRFAIITAALFVFGGLFPVAAQALGVAGFDIYRADKTSPDSAYKFNLKPSESVKDRIVIRNTSKAVQKLRIYTADATPTTNGGIALKERTDRRIGLAKWLDIHSTPIVELKPGESRDVWFTLSVPKNSDAAEKLAGIVVERVAAIKDKSSKQFSINVLPRVAILVTQRVPGPASLNLNIVDFEQLGNVWSHPRQFNLSLKNEGNVVARPTGKIEIFNIFGGKSATIQAPRLATLFPGVSNATKIEWQNTPYFGYFTAKATVNYGDKTVTKQTRVLILSWWLILIVLVPMVAWWIYRRRTAKPDGKPKDGEQAGPSTEAQQAMETLSTTLDEIGRTPTGITAAANDITTAASSRSTATTATVIENETIADKPKRRGRPPKKKTDDETVAKAEPKKTAAKKAAAKPKKAVAETTVKKTAAKPKKAPEAEDKPKRRGRPPKKKD